MRKLSNTITISFQSSNLLRSANSQLEFIWMSYGISWQNIIISPVKSIAVIKLPEAYDEMFNIVIKISLSFLS